MDSGAFLKKYTERVLEAGKRYPDDSLPVLEYGSYTVLKIISVHYYGEMFAKIAKGPSARQHRYDGAVYVDLFAGPGLVKIKETGDVVAGSPLAVNYSKYQFDFSIFLEKKAEYLRALQSRLKSHLPENAYTIIPGDCNSNVAEIIREIKQRYRNPIVFTFIDPEGMESKWSTIQALTEEFHYMDIMINVTSGAARVAGRISSGMMGDRPIFEDYFHNVRAEDILVKIDKGERVAEIYANAVKTTLGKPIGTTIPIRDHGDNEIYNILGYTRESLTGSPWKQGFDQLHDKFKDITGDDVTSMLDVIQKRRPSLDSAFGLPN